MAVLDSRARGRRGERRGGGGRREGSMQRRLSPPGPELTQPAFRVLTYGRGASTRLWPRSLARLPSDASDVRFITTSAVKHWFCPTERTGGNGGGALRRFSHRDS